MSIKVKSLGLVKNEDIEIKAVASLEVDGMKIDGIRVNESENGNLYLQFPDRKFKKKSLSIPQRPVRTAKRQSLQEKR